MNSKTIQVPVGNGKFIESFKFQIDAPFLKYCQKTLNSCCFGRLASEFASINHYNAAIYISLRIEESLKSEVGKCIDFENNILKNNKRNKGEARVTFALIFSKIS